MLRWQIAGTRRDTWRFSRLLSVYFVARLGECIDTKWYEADISLQNMLTGCLHCLTDELTIHHMHVQHQTNNIDCGLFTTVFAICSVFWTGSHSFEIFSSSDPATAVETVAGEDTATISQHCDSSTQTNSSYKSMQLFCVCHIPDDGWEMVQCDRCDRWYHASCVGLYNRARDWFCNGCVVDILTYIPM